METPRVTTFCRKAFAQRFIATIQASNTWNLRSEISNEYGSHALFMSCRY